MGLTPAWTKLKYHEQQSRAWRSRARFAALAAGRGSGKTEISRRKVVRFLPVKKPWPDPLYFYALPTVQQAKRVAWEPLLKLIPPDWIKGQPNRTEMVIRTVFGSSLYVVGMDKPQRIEGVQWDGGIVDESCDQHPGVFDRSIMPALSHKEGWCWRIGVPKRFGVGAGDFKTWSQKHGVEAYSWASSDILRPEEIELAKSLLDERDYREQYEASWESIGGSIFYAFDELHNVRNVAYDPSLPLVVGSDFNVSPMAWVIGHLVDDKYLHIVDELFVRDTNTRETLDILYRKYGQHPSGWYFFGDATAQARKTAASASDYVQIKTDERFKGARILYPRSNPSRVDRFASCNALLCNTVGERRCFIHPKCKNLIKDLQARSWKEGVREPDDGGDVGHITDALGYIIHRRFPSTSITLTSAPQVHTG